MLFGLTRFQIELLKNSKKSFISTIKKSNKQILFIQKLMDKKHISYHKFYVNRGFNILSQNHPSLKRKVGKKLTFIPES